MLEFPTLAVAVAVYAGFLVLTAFFDHVPLPVAALAGSLLLAWYGSFQHETIHGHPTRWRRLNRALGWLPLSLWIPYAVYREMHLKHHRHGGRYLTEAGRDPESFYIAPEELKSSSSLRRRMHAANCTLAGRLTLGPALAMYNFLGSELRLVLRGDRRRVRIWAWHAVGVSLVLTWVVGVCRIPFTVYLALFVYPSLAITHLRSFVEHHAGDDPRTRTRVVEAHPVWGLIFLNNNLHIAHHAHPRLPWYQLPRVWRQMRGSVAARALVFDGYLNVARAFLFRRYIGSADVRLPGTSGSP